MTIHKMKQEFVVKPSIMELMAALDGVVCAGVTVTKNGPDKKTGIVAGAGYEAAILSYDLRTKLSFGRIDADRAASQMTKFLSVWRERLLPNADVVLSLPKGTTGGTLKDVFSHIEDILERENDGKERPGFKFINGGLQNKFNAAYLPRAQKEEAEEPELNDDDVLADGPAPKKETAKRGRKKAAYAWAGRVSALT